MNKTLLFLSCCIPLFLCGQTIDSVAVKQVDSLILISRAFTDEQGFEKALETGTLAEKIAREKCGQESVSYGNACFNMGRVFYFKGDFEAAEPWYLNAKAIREKILGNVHIEYSKSLNNLAILYDEMGQYEKAEPLYLETLAIRERAIGKKSPGYADALSNLAGLYMQMGLFEEAEIFGLEAMDIRAEVVGTAHPAYASSLNNLANLYFTIGVNDKAEQFYLESKAIREKAGDVENPDYILVLDNLGALYQTVGQYEKAEPLYLQVKALIQKAQGEAHPTFVLVLSHLAVLYHVMKQHDRAESLYLQADSLGKAILGEAHPNYLSNAIYYADLLNDLGQYEKAESLLLKSKRTFENAIGKNHPTYVELLRNLAKGFQASGNFDAAKTHLLAAIQIERDLTIKASRHLSERELSVYIQPFFNRLNRDLYFSQNRPDLSASCYDQLLFYKGFLLNAVSQISRLTRNDPAAAEPYNEFKSLHRRLAAEYAKPASERHGVAVLEEKANAAEKKLARQVAGFGASLRQVRWQEVQAALKAGEAAIEFVHYQEETSGTSGGARYAALVLRSGTQQPEFIPVFEENLLNNLLQSKNQPKPDFLNQLYTFGKQGKTLYFTVWQPLEKALSGVETIYFSPSGLLHRLNFSAIPESAERTLADRYRLVEMGSTRQLAAPSGLPDKEESAAAVTAGEGWLFGGLHYELDSAALVAANPNLTGPPLAVRSRGLRVENTDRTHRGGVWDYLKWTDIEVISLEAIFSDADIKTHVYQGYEGTEETFKANGTGTASPRVLHFATHGFFYAAPLEGKEEHGSNLPSEGMEGAVFKTSDHPMMRSGLILAGANFAWKNGRPFNADREDGILTAYEISRMNLDNTELAVLSACETGLGEIQSQEGVYGLQRAFKIAGVKYLVMSLWQVPDFQTQEFMTNFYGHWLEDKMTVSDAFRATQKAMRAKYKDPFEWAGFILVE